MSGHINKVEICSSCAQPVHVSVCNFPTEIDNEYSETLWCLGGAAAIRESRWVDGVQTITWRRPDNIIFAPTIGQLNSAQPGACLTATDTEIVERFVCAAGVTLVQRTLFTNGIAGTVTYFGVNGATVAAPAAFTEGACDDQDIDIESEQVCASNVTLTRRRIVDGETGTLISETFIGANGATVAAPTVYTQGPCCDAAPTRELWKAVTAVPASTSTVNLSAWQYSADSGATWVNGAGPFPQTIGPRGRERFRSTFVSPCSGTATINVAGDILGDPPSGPNTGMQVRIDGAVVAEPTQTELWTMYNGGAPILVTFPTVAGQTHTVEFWMADSTTVGNSQVYTSQVSVACAATETCAQVFRVTACNGTVTWVTQSGAVYTPVGTESPGTCPVACCADTEIVETLACAAGVQVLRTQTFKNGTLTATAWTGANGATIPAPASYTWGQCAGSSSSPDVELLALCDASGTAFLQVTSYLAGVPTVTNRNLANTAAYTPLAPVGPCDDIDVERETICYQNGVNAAVVRATRIATYRDGTLISTAWVDPLTGAGVVAPPASATVVECPEQARTQTQSIVQSGTAVGATINAAAGFGGYTATLVWTLTTAPPNSGRGTFGTVNGVGVPLGYSVSVEADENWTIANDLAYAVSVAGAKWVIVRRTA